MTEKTNRYRIKNYTDAQTGIVGVEGGFDNSHGIPYDGSDYSRPKMA
jgi:hypothetical protein